MKVTRLGEVARIYNGNSINEKVKAEKFTGLIKGIPYVSTKDISYTYQVKYENGVKIPSSNAHEFKLAKKGSVLLCAEGGSAGRKMAIIDRDVFFVNKLFCFECNTEISSRFLFYYLQTPTFQTLFKNAITGLIGGVSLEKVRNLTIVLPSLDKQADIVEKLDRVFAEIDLLEESLALRDERLNNLLLSLLSEAFIATPDENELGSTSGDQSVVTKLVTLGTVAEVIAGQSPEGIYYNSIGDGAPFYQGKKEFGDKFLGAPTTWTTKVTKLAQPGDILMSVRAPVGPINFTTQEICIGRGLASIRASKLLNKDFLYYFLLHKQPEISGNTGAVFDSINKEQIASIEIPLLSLEKQKIIVEKLNSVFAAIDSLKMQIRKEKEYAVALRQSLLRNVFTQEEAVA